MTDPSPKLEGLRQHSFFTSSIEPRHLAMLSEIAEEVEYAPGEILFREGDLVSHFYLLLSGEVSLEVRAGGTERTVLTLRGGDELGWLSLARTSPMLLQVRVLSPTRALAFDSARLLAICEAEPLFGYRLMKHLLGVLADKLEAVERHLLHAMPMEPPGPQELAAPPDGQPPLSPGDRAGQ